MLVQERGGEKSRTQVVHFFPFLSALSVRTRDRQTKVTEQAIWATRNVRTSREIYLFAVVSNQTATQNERCELERSWNALKEEVNALLKTMDVKEQTMKQPDAEHKVPANDLNKMLKVLKDEANTTKQLQLLNDLQKQIELLLATVKRTVNTQILPSQTSIYVY
jgi:valyl-tRNA synthetase